MKRVIYVLPYLHQFRSDLFIGLEKLLKRVGVSLVVMHGEVKSKKVIVVEDGNSYPRHVYPSSVFLKLTRMIGLFRDFKKMAPAGVVLLYSPSNLTMLHIVLYCWLKHIPYATWRCGYDRDGYSFVSKIVRTIVIDRIVKQATCNITYGTWYKNVLVKKGISSDKVVVAQNTINVESIIEKNKAFKRTYQNAETRILFVGALIKRKYLPSSIDAIGQLLEMGYDVVFNIVGGGTIIDELRSYVNEQNLANVVHVHGPKYGEELREFFCNNDVFLAAGLGGLALNEAMAYGLPIITTPVDGTGYDLVDGNGYLMEDYGNTELQVKCLKNFISLSSDEKIKMSERSKELVSSIASLNNLIDKHASVCRMLTLEK